MSHLEIKLYLPGPFSVSYEKGKFEGKDNTQNSKANRERESESNTVLKMLFVFLALGMQRFTPDLICMGPCLQIFA